jgi:DNA-binding cell septation regulator SpoVG
MTEKVAKEFKGNVGIFLVASKLSAMNIIALTTSRNTKGYDIVALNPETNKGKGIQVKCADVLSNKKEDFPVVSALFRTMHEELCKKIICDFVFVDISNIEQPKFFILSKDEVINIIETNTKVWLARKHRKTPEESNKKILHTIKRSEIEKYENNWNQILQDLL